MLNNIRLLIMAYGAVQCSAIALLAFFCDIPFFLMLFFFLVAVLWHLLLFYFLHAQTKSFFLLPKGEPLTNINLANKITFLRAASVSFVFFLLYFINVSTVKNVLGFTLVAIFFTDAIDGHIARKYNEVTSIGQMMDSMSDYALLTVISVAYWYYGIVPVWFFSLIFARLALQSLGVCFFLFLGYPLEVRSTIGGKWTIGATMCLYSLELFSLIFPFIDFLEKVLSFAEQCCAFIVFIFIFEKVLILVDHWSDYQKHQS